MLTRLVDVDSNVKLQNAIMRTQGISSKCQVDLNSHDSYANLINFPIVPESGCSNASKHGACIKMSVILVHSKFI